MFIDEIETELNIRKLYGMMRNKAISDKYKNLVQDRIDYLKPKKVKIVYVEKEHSIKEGICEYCGKSFNKSIWNQKYCPTPRGKNDIILDKNSCAYKIKEDLRRNIASKVKYEKKIVYRDYIEPKDCFRIYIPNTLGTEYYEEEGYSHYNIPKSCLEHKKYPTCRCGRLFVPVEKGDKICFFCKFTS